MPGQSVLDLQIFAASILAGSDGLTAAFRALESCLAGPDIPLDLIVQDLCSVPNLFEFIISVFPSAKGLVDRILDTYPTDPPLVETSFASTLLRRLSSVFFALPPNLFPTDNVDIGRSRVYVDNALPVLALLCSTHLSPYFATRSTATCASEDPEYDNKAFSGPPDRNMDQKKSKLKNKNATTTVDISPFHRLGVELPLHEAEATKMAEEISHKLKMILKLYLELLLERSLAPQLKYAYFPDNSTARTPPPQVAKVVETVESKPSAYTKFQPVKTALHFENAAVFGEWRVIISTDATKKLRELASNNDKEKCITVLKTIRQLSKGYFSDENQRRLNGSAGVPIFEAKMRRDLRLVYQVDVFPDNHCEVERQVIKIYGIYTSTELSCIWDAMGQQLARKGREYCQRCIFRYSPIRGRHGDVYSPACFPPESLETDTQPVSLNLSDGDKEELHYLLVLEKYVTFSQAILNSLILSRDVQHVFELTPKERQIVECSTSCCVLGRSGTGKTTTMVFKMLGIQQAWEMQRSNMPKPRQIFVTKSRVLALKVQEHFAKQLEFLALASYSRDDLKEMRAQSLESGLVDVDDVEQVDIPQKYSALEDNHFPLFVTFDKLATMIAADVLSGDDPEAKRSTKFFINAGEVHAQDTFVTYEVFERTYWPHFSQPLTKGLDPRLVFSEFIGVIKGSEKSLWCPGGFLDEEAYCNLPARSNPTFANQRQTLYTLFKAYCKLKKERYHHDVADRTHTILKTLEGRTQLRGQKVDYLYIDEAQDNLLIDVLLLRYICRNSEGLFWAGDTAQTISAGCSFRFDDLKALLYRIERGQSTLAHLIDERSATNPTTFHLTDNYRSHGGIVNCAHTVIERITCFWPDSIDRLQPEHGIVDGFRPVFFHGWDEDTFRKELFFFGDESESPIEFGAHQCILVRDDKALQKLRNEVGEIGLIMTLCDSKGLEFNDVLLYNFFEDSPVDVLRWSVLLNYLVGGVRVDGHDLARIHAPSFDRDEGRFAGVCSELKLLYVGITRARKNLWIFDKSNKGDPMRIIWSSRNQIQIRRPGSDVPRLAVSSTPEEWESSGHDLFKHKKYPQAIHCFTRAMKPRLVAICKAYHLREVARAKVGVAKLKVQQDAFLTAANAFVESARDAPKGKDKLQYYRSAADCYVRAGDDHKAAYTYLDAQEYDLAARRFRKVGLFDKTLEVLHKHSREIPSETSEELYTVCRLFYCSKRDTVRPHLPLFPTFEEELEFLEEYDLDSARATLLENRERYLEAAELHLSENRPLNAIRDFLKEGSHDAIQRASKAVLDSLWRRCSFHINPREVAADQSVRGLLELARELPADLLDPLDRHEISMFRSIAQADFVVLGELFHEFLKPDENRNAPALLALDHFFSSLPSLKSYKLQEMSLFLETFRTYISMLYRIFTHANPLSIYWIRQLFCIREISDTDYTLGDCSCLCNTGSSDYDVPRYLQGPVVALSKQQVVSALRGYLESHLCERVKMENDLCYEAVAFSPCLNYTVNHQCNRGDCSFDHPNPLDLDARYYNTRIGIHLSQMCILQCMYYARPGLVRRKTVVYWLVHLYEAFYPQSHIQGSIADLDLSVIPVGKEGWGVMKNWVWEALRILRVHHYSKEFFTTALKLMKLLFIFDKSNALQWINRAYFITRDIRPQELVYPNGCDSVKDLLNFFDGTMRTSVSAGLKFLRHVLHGTLIVNLSTFCDCFEDVVGKISVSCGLSNDPPLDGLVLPRSWLSSNKDFVRKKDINIPLVLDLLDCVRDLVVFLQSGTANERYTLLRSRPTQALCNVFTSRICRALCLLAHNIQNTKVVLSVKNTLSALQSAGPMQRARFIFRKYTLVEPSDYLKVIVTYDANVVIQDLVQLLHKRKAFRRPLLLPRLTHIHFENPLDIPSLVTPQIVKACSSLRADAPVFVPRAPQTEVAKDPTAVETLPIDSDEPQELPPAIDEPALIFAQAPTEEETNAVQKIQTVYRTYCKRRAARTSVDIRGLKARTNTVFLACLKNAINWQKNTYRTLYLWAIPHLVACLDEVTASASESKSKTKRLLLKESHDRLEEVVERTNRINALLQENRKLRRIIEPNATMHERKDKIALKQVASDIRNFISANWEFVTLSDEAQNSCELAWKLVTTKTQPTAKEKPTLNTEDL